jgi:hypothetical protein
MVLRILLLLFWGMTNYLCAYQGEGEGTTRQEAINVALNSIASQISTTVSSKLKIIKESNNQGYNKDVEQVIYADVNDISFNNYEIITKRRDRKKYFIILKVDEKRLAKGYATRIGQKLKQITNELQQDSIFKRYLILKKYNFSNLFSQTYIMSSIDPTSPHKEYINELERLNKLKVEYQQNLVFQVTSSDSSIKNIANSVLNQASLMTSDFGKLKFNITLSPLAITKIYKKLSATSKATIEIIEESHTVYSKTMQLSATSYISEHYLKEEILKALESELKKSLEILK